MESNEILLKPEERDPDNNDPVEERMRLFVNCIIDRVFEDRKNGIYK